MTPPFLVDFGKTSKKGVRDVQGSSDSFGGTVRIAADNADRVKCIAEHLEQFVHEDGGGECLENYLVCVSGSSNPASASTCVELCVENLSRFPLMARNPLIDKALRGSC